MGERFGDYELLRKIATGGMAEIYLARLNTVEGFSRTVVVKRMLPQLAIRDDFVTMFLDEARLAANLGHPNIVQVFNLGETDGSYYMAMELIDGPHLGALFAHSLRRRSPLPIELCVFATARAADGLHYAHEMSDPMTGKHMGIVHRDISPQNILVSRHGDVKVTDFGVAKATTQEAKTRTGVIKGKVSYMSPEQCLGEKVDRRTDVFALGIVLYELLTRRRLFRDKSDLLVMQKITSEDVKPPSRLNPALDEELDAICIKALARDREERFESAGDLSEALDTWLALHQHPDCRTKLSKWMAEYAPDLGLSQIDVEDSAASVPVAAGSAVAVADDAAPADAAAADDEGTASTPALHSKEYDPDATDQNEAAPAGDPLDLESLPQRTDATSIEPTIATGPPSADDVDFSDKTSESTPELALEPASDVVGPFEDGFSGEIEAPPKGRLPMAAMLGGGAAIALAVIVGVVMFGDSTADPVVGVRPDDGSVEPSPEPGPDKPPPRGEEQEHVSLRIKTVPDGVPVAYGDASGTSPVDVKVAPQGDMEIRVSFDTGSVIRRVNVEGDTEVVLKAPVALTVKSKPPKATVTVTAEGLGTLNARTPTKPGALSLEPDRDYVVEVELDGYELFTKELKTKAGEPMVVNAELVKIDGGDDAKTERKRTSSKPKRPKEVRKEPRKEYAKLKILSRPWVNVKVVGGGSLGPTPVQPSRVRLRNGRARLRVVNDQAGISQTVSVPMRDGDEKTVILTFEQKGSKWTVRHKVR